MKHLPLVLLLGLATTPAFAQASADVDAGPLHSHAQAGPVDPARTEDDRQAARGPRTDDTRNCDSRGVTVENKNGSASASASSSGGSSVVAGAGSPGSQTRFFGCDAPTAHR